MTAIGRESHTQQTYKLKLNEHVNKQHKVNKALYCLMHNAT